MKELVARHISCEIEKITKPKNNISIPQLQAQRHRLEGFGRAVMLYGDMDGTEFQQLRRDAYVAFARGTGYLMSHWSPDPCGVSPASPEPEEIELFGSVEAADRAFRGG